MSPFLSERCSQESVCYVRLRACPNGNANSQGSSHFCCLIPIDAAIIAFVEQLHCMQLINV